MSKSNWVVCSIFLVLFALFAYLASQSYTFPGDIAVSLWLQSINLPGFYSLMVAISFLHSWYSAVVVVALVSGGLLFSGKRLEVIFIILLTGLSSLLNSLLKWLISRPRPGGEIQMLTESNGFSFPSGHIVYATVFYGFIFYLTPKLIKRTAVVTIIRVVLVLLILLTVTSRIYLGAHWLSDALGSFWLSGLLLIVTVNLYNNYTWRKNA
ncbi:MAG: phosphatase PAP2 family protein [Chloroflexota bacterium]